MHPAFVTGHPYRKAAPPPDAPSDAPHEGAPDTDIAAFVGIALVASIAQVAWATVRGHVDEDFVLALGTALLCAAVLRPLAGWWAARLWRRVSARSSRGSSAARRGRRPAAP